MWAWICKSECPCEKTSKDGFLSNCQSWQCLWVLEAMNLLFKVWIFGTISNHLTNSDDKTEMKKCKRIGRNSLWVQRRGFSKKSSANVLCGRCVAPQVAIIQHWVNSLSWIAITRCMNLYLTCWFIYVNLDVDTLQIRLAQFDSGSRLQ